VKDRQASVMMIVYRCSECFLAMQPPDSTFLLVIQCHPDSDERAVPEDALHAAVRPTLASTATDVEVWVHLPAPEELTE
jgi:hypothetical protein